MNSRSFFLSIGWEGIKEGGVTMSWIRLCTAVLLLMLLWGCGGMKVSYDYDSKIDFSKIKTYDWLPAEGDASELTVKRIKDSVDRELNLKGLSRTSEQPDCLIGMEVSGKTVYGGSTGVGASVGIPVGGGTVSIGGGRTRAHEKREGTLVLSLMDSGSRSLMWKGTVTSVVNPNASPKSQEDLINYAVKDMLSHFPPEGK
jgi:Domain of unknown function (DUF4136)